MLKRKPVPSAVQVFSPDLDSAVADLTDPVLEAVAPTGQALEAAALTGPASVVVASTAQEAEPRLVFQRASLSVEEDQPSLAPIL